MQRTHQSILSVLALTALALSTSSAALASGYIHSEPNEKGYTVHPQHFKSDKTRAQIQSETEAFFKKEGAHRNLEESNPSSHSQQPSTATRQGVMNDYLNESPEQRKARLSAIAG